DYEKYLEGFDEVEDIFQYVIDSKYFNPKIFEYEQLNHQNRTRNKKRKNYELFLQYVKDNPKGKNITYAAADGTGTPTEVFMKEKYVFPKSYKLHNEEWKEIPMIDRYVEKAEKFFGVEIRSEIDSWKERVDQEKRASGIFNGNVVMEHFPLRGKELGAAMKNFNDYLNSLIPSATPEEHKLLRSRWILDNNMETIFRVFKDVNNLN
ncbi:unnamed protein product, partial [marine sediment metagenome]